MITVFIKNVPYVARTMQDTFNTDIIILNRIEYDITAERN